MPIYDISCPNCGTLETILKIDDDVVCPICGGPAKKVIGAVNFEFKCAMPTWSGGKSGIKSNQWNDKPKMPKKKEN